jgi:hypothetical protein
MNSNLSRWLIACGAVVCLSGAAHAKSAPNASTTLGSGFQSALEIAQSSGSFASHASGATLHASIFFPKRRCDVARVTLRPRGCVNPLGFAKGSVG